jgi:hypothetical protein
VEEELGVVLTCVVLLVVEALEDYSVPAPLIYMQPTTLLLSELVVYQGQMEATPFLQTILPSVAVMVPKESALAYQVPMALLAVVVEVKEVKRLSGVVLQLQVLLVKDLPVVSVLVLALAVLVAELVELPTLVLPALDMSAASQAPPLPMLLVVLVVVLLLDHQIPATEAVPHTVILARLPQLPPVDPALWWSAIQPQLSSHTANQSSKLRAHIPSKVTPNKLLA